MIARLLKKFRGEKEDVKVEANPTANKIIRQKQRRYFTLARAKQELAEELKKTGREDIAEKLESDAQELRRRALTKDFLDGMNIADTH